MFSWWECHTHLIMVTCLSIECHTGSAIPHTTNTASLPPELLATNTHDTVTRHILPPFYPTLVDVKLKKDKEKGEG